MSTKIGTYLGGSRCRCGGLQLNCLLTGRHRRHGVRVCVMDAELHRLLLVEIHNPRVEIRCLKVLWLAEELPGLMLCVGVLHIGQQVHVDIPQVLQILPSCEKGVLSNKLALISGIIHRIISMDLLNYILVELKQILAIIKIC